VKRISIILWLAVYFSGISYAQQNTYVVFFNDKASTTYSLNNPSEFLSQRAIDRRSKQNIEFDSLDIPVVKSYIQEVRDLGVDVFLSTKWMNGIIVQTEPNNVTGIENLAVVKEVIYVSPTTKLSFQGRVSATEEQQEVENSATNAQLDMLGINTLHAQGFEGQGMLMAVLDGGFSGVDSAPAFSHLFDQDKVIMAFDFIENDDNVYHASSHGTNVFSIIAAKEEGEYNGAASEANFMLFRTEDPAFVDEYRIEEYNWLIAAEKADSAGADIITSSVGYSDFEDPAMSYTYEQMDGKTTVITRAADLVFDKGILVITSAGNKGNKTWQYITAPADANNIISVGSVDSDFGRSNFSSIGPTSDGRTKPEVMALGRNTSVISSNGFVTTNSGTSFAAPLVAGLSALLWQKESDLTNIELRNKILSLGDQSDLPDNQYGHGIPTYEFILSTEEIETQTVRLYPNPITGGILTIELRNVNDSFDLKIFNLQGSLIKSQTLKATNNVRIDLSGVDNGVYLIEILSDKLVYKSKVIKR